MYAEDTFFHLSMTGQAGLVILSVLLALSTIAVFSKISSRFAFPVKVLVAVACFWVFVWLSPQVYYWYFLSLFDALPVQWIIGKPPGLPDIVRLISFSGKASLATHSTGGLFWGLILVACLQSSIKSQSRTFGK